MDRPKISKARIIRGHRLHLRDATSDDAEFILSLRVDTIKSRYLGKTSGDLGLQREWLRQYATTEDQAYFIVERDGSPIGTVRIYDARGSRFCLGSLIMSNGAGWGASIEALLIIISYAIDDLGFGSSYFSVRKANERVWKFYERVGIERTGETEEDFHYVLGLEGTRAMLERYKRFLPCGITVSRLGTVDLQLDIGGSGPRG